MNWLEDAVAEWNERLRNPAPQVMLPLRSGPLRVRPGLQALGRDSGRVSPTDPRKLVGSVDIDGDLARSLPDAPRWDYVVGHGEDAWFVEVHPAGSPRNAREVLAKRRWLRDQLSGRSLEGRARGYAWIATGRVDIPKTSRALKELAELGVAPPRTAPLRLP